MPGAPNNPFFDSEPGGREVAPGPLALVQAFVNTREAERGLEALTAPGTLRRWLVERDILSGKENLREADVGRAREVREALRVLLVANNGRAVDPRAVQTLNRTAGRARLEIRFGADGGTLLEPVSDGADGALGRILAAVYAGMEQGTWQRLKVCRNEACRWAFYDRSKNRSGEWCSMAVCGNRKKIRTYRRRRGDREV